MYMHVCVTAVQVFTCPTKGTCQAQQLYGPSGVVGTQRNGTTVCAGAHTGRLCASCVQDYYMAKNGTCVDCGEGSYLLHSG